MSGSVFARGWWAATVLLGLCGNQVSGVQTGGGPLEGHVAPSFHVQGVCGEDYSLETFKGHILVMQFGASW